MIPTALAAETRSPDRLSAVSLTGPVVWTVELDLPSGLRDPERSGPDLTGGLAPEEAEQCRRLRRPADQWAYAVAHRLLRRQLAAALGVAPAAVVLGRDRGGKPFLAQPAGSGLHFNLSHTQGLVAVALYPAGSVGVDVEAEDRPAVLDSALLDFALHAGEREALAALPAARRPAAFFRRWTVREAVAKADGRGLSLPFADIHLSLPDSGPDADPAAIAAAADGEAMVTQPPARMWRVWCRRLASRHHLALAWSPSPAVPGVPRLYRLAWQELLPAAEDRA